MDAKMKGKIMIGMVVASLLFALMAVMGGSWMSIDDDGDAIDVDFTLGGMEMSEDGISMKPMMMTRGALLVLELLVAYSFG